MNILSIEAHNESLLKNREDYIKRSEQCYNDNIMNVAKPLTFMRGEKPIILISGPSGSGKTTTALRLAAMLNSLGCKTHCLSMDNYFLPLNDIRNEKDENGRIDLESPKRLDIELLNEQLESIFESKEITLPVFDFVNQVRTEGDRFHRLPGELVIIEGIHALNPMVTGAFHDKAVMVYVSVRTRLQNSLGQLLHPSMIRLMRRLMRDKLFRGRGAVDTLEFFRWVERGEQLYIMPHKHLALFDIDTFIPYEASIYRSFLLPELKALDGDYYDFEQYRDMTNFLQEIESMPIELVPENSLIREFVGGSSFQY